MHGVNKNKIVLAILSCGFFPGWVHAVSFQNAKDLGSIALSNGVLRYMGSASVPVGTVLKVANPLYLNTQDFDMSGATLYLRDKGTSLVLDAGTGSVLPGFKSSVISSEKAWAAVELHGSSLAGADRPKFTGKNVDIFSEGYGGLGLDVKNGVLDLKDVAISARQTALKVDDSSGGGSQIDLENFDIRFDAKRFNELVGNTNFTTDKKTESGVSITGTGVKGESVTRLRNGSIMVSSVGISADNAAAIIAEHVNVVSAGLGISSFGKDSHISVSQSTIKALAKAAWAGYQGSIDLDDVTVERSKEQHGLLAENGGLISIKDSQIVTVNDNPNLGGGDHGAIQAADAGSKIIADNVNLLDGADVLDGAIGITSSGGAEVIGNKVVYHNKVSRTTGVYGSNISLSNSDFQFGGTDSTGVSATGKVVLADSRFQLAGDDSVGVQTQSGSDVVVNHSEFTMMGKNSSGLNAMGGEFTANNSKFASQGNLIEISNFNWSPVNIHLNQQSVFESDGVLLQKKGSGDAFLTADDSRLAGRVVTAGGAVDISLKNNASWSYAGTSQLRNLALDHSFVQLQQPAVGVINTLDVAKLHGQNSVIELWTEFNGDASASDLIRVRQEATGQTGLRFKNKGGSGEQTVNGIKVVDAVDASASGGSKAVTAQDAFLIDAGSDGYRQGKGTIAAGAYEYSLKKGGKNQDESWYLQSIKMDDPGTEDPDPRPEVEIYFANRASMLAMQQHRLKQRVMDDWTAPVGWVRLENNWESLDSQFGNRRKSDMQLAHFGLDLLRKDFGDKGRLQLGVMGLIGQNESRASNTIGSAKGKTKGYNLGAYATWYQNQDSNIGAYVDSWLMHGWFKNSVQGTGLAEEKYDSRALSASLEAGYGFELPSSHPNRHYTLQPQAQVIVSHLHSDNVYEKTKTQVVHENGSQAAYRLGVRFQGDIKRQDENVVSPYAELNFWHKPQNGSIRFDQVAIRDKTPSHITEVVMGVKLRVKQGWDVSWQLNYQQGKQSYHQAAVQAGARYQWK
jgi:outer membrane autotransporter protein